MEEEMKGPPPMCPSCTHPHFPTQKCQICGHTGKGKAFMLIPKTTGPSSQTLHFECFDSRTADSKRPERQEYKNKWALARILRNRVFVEEEGIAEAAEFDGVDNECRHVLGLVGDAPVLYARWRFEDVQPEGRVAVIDRMLVLKSYRERGYSRRTLEFLIQDIAATATELQQWVGGIVVTIPVEWAELAQKLHGSRFEPYGAPYPERGSTFMRMIMRAGELVPS